MVFPCWRQLIGRPAGSGAESPSDRMRPGPVKNTTCAALRRRPLGPAGPKGIIRQAPGAAYLRTFAVSFIIVPARPVVK